MMVMCANQTGMEVGYLAGRHPGALGHLYSPGSERGPYSYLPYALDNGAYVAWTKNLNFDYEAWIWLLVWARLSGQEPLWALVPDAVADRDRTLASWNTLAPLVRRAGFRPALAIQDGMTFDDVPDSECMLFLGGTTGWKEAAIKPWCERFPGRVHVGRVNTMRRLLACYEAGAVSIDGTGWFHKAERRALVRWLEETCSPSFADTKPKLLTA